MISKASIERLGLKGSDRKAQNLRLWNAQIRNDFVVYCMHRDSAGSTVSTALRFIRPTNLVAAFGQTFWVPFGWTLRLLN